MAILPLVQKREKPCLGGLFQGQVGDDFEDKFEL
jgi:hypothetical protein